MLAIKVFDWSALAGYCGLIFWISSQSSLPTPMLFEFQDKLMHGGAYFGMGVLCWRAFGHLNFAAKHRLLAGVLFCGLYGFSDEWHQSFVPGRDASGWDWLADSVGAVLALWLMQSIHAFRGFIGRYHHR